MLALNPRNSNAIAWMGAFTTHKGDYDRGRALMERAIALNPVHPGWYHFVSSIGLFSRGEFEDALAARQDDMPQNVWVPVGGRHCRGSARAGGRGQGRA